MLLCWDGWPYRSYKEKRTQKLLAISNKCNFQSFIQRPAETNMLLKAGKSNVF